MEHDGPRDGGRLAARPRPAPVRPGLAGAGLGGRPGAAVPAGAAATAPPPAAALRPPPHCRLPHPLLPLHPAR